MPSLCALPTHVPSAVPCRAAGADSLWASWMASTVHRAAAGPHRVRGGHGWAWCKKGERGSTHCKRFSSSWIPGPDSHVVVPQEASAAPHGPPQRAPVVSVTHVDYTGAASPGPEFTSVDLHTKAGTKNPLFKAIVGEFGSESLLPHFPVAHMGLSCQLEKGAASSGQQQPGTCESSLWNIRPHAPPAPLGRHAHTGHTSCDHSARLMRCLCYQQPAGHLRVP